MLSIGFILLSLAIAVIILWGFNAGMQKAGIKKNSRRKQLSYAIIGMALWAIYIIVLDKTNVINSFELPPRFPILLIFPLFAFTGFFLYRHRNNPTLHAIPKSWPVYYQSFRIFIESLFVFSLSENLLPTQVTFEGYNYDIVFAASAAIVAYLAFNRKLISERIVLFWNYLGLTVIAFIIFLFTTTFFFPAVWGSETTLANEAVFSFAFMLVPGFLMPSAVFMHILSIIQLRERNVTKHEQHLTLSRN